MIEAIRAARRPMAIIAAGLFACFTGSSALSAEVVVRDGGACLKVNQDDPRGDGGSGRNVIVGADCADDGAQNWRVVAGQITIGAAGAGACLAIDMGAPAGRGGSGRNVIAWPDCDGGSNQTWSIENGFVFANADGGRWCLEMNADEPTGEEGGFNVIATTNCYGADEQTWSLR